MKCQSFLYTNDRYGTSPSRFLIPVMWCKLRRAVSRSLMRSYKTITRRPATFELRDAIFLSRTLHECCQILFGCAYILGKPLILIGRAIREGTLPFPSLSWLYHHLVCVLSVGGFLCRVAIQRAILLVLTQMYRCAKCHLLH